ncbi:MAG TPA: hypothetical protein VMU54_12645, partial [Planctomycetota bacterium]|nr:hypothetical protein [Planctomycetota bacterium]
TSVPTRAGKLLARITDPVFCRELAAIVGSRRDKDEVAMVIRDVAQSDARRQSAILTGLAEGMNRRSIKLGDFLGSLPEAALANAILAKAGGIASDASRPLAERIDAIRLLIHVPWETAAPALSALVAEDQPGEIQIAAVGALSSHARAEVPKILLGAWKKALPALRREILEAMSRRPERLSALLDEIEGGRMTPGELGPTLLRQLQSYGDAGIRERAKRLIASNLPEERQKVIDRYKEALGMPGDPKRGREIFRATCSPCHRIADIGTLVGPDISDTLTKAPEQLLVDILDPSRVIDNNYVNYVVRLKSGAVLSGFIASQTASSLTLRRGAGQEDIVLRQEIDEMKSSGVSLMPDGLEKSIPVQGMADLLAFLKGWRFIDAPERQQR